MKYKELIQAELEKQGLSKDLFDKIKVENEADIEKAVSDFKAGYTPPKKQTLAEFLEENGTTEEFNQTVTKLLQSEVDKRVTQALKTFEQKMKDENGKTEGGQGSKSDEQLAALQEKIDALSEALTGQQKQQEQQRLKDLAAAKLKEKGLPASWLDRVNVEKDADIEGAVEKLDAEYKEIKQGIIDKAIEENPIPGMGTPGGTKTGQAAIDDFIKSKKSENGQNVQTLG